MRWIEKCTASGDRELVEQGERYAINADNALDDIQMLWRLRPSDLNTKRVMDNVETSQTSSLW
jgi:hypothetical protein